MTRSEAIELAVRRAAVVNAAHMQENDRPHYISALLRLWAQGDEVTVVPIKAIRAHFRSVVRQYGVQ